MGLFCDLYPMEMVSWKLKYECADMFSYLNDNFSFLSMRECLLSSNSDSMIHRVAEIHFSGAVNNGVQSNHREGELQNEMRLSIKLWKWSNFLCSEM